MTKFWKSPWGCAAMILMGLTLWGGLIVYFARKSDPFLAEVTLADGKTRLRLLSISEGPFDYEWQPPRSSMIFPWGSGIPSISIHLSGIDPWTREPGYTWMFRTVDELSLIHMLRISLTLEHSPSHAVIIPDVIERYEFVFATTHN